MGDLVNLRQARKRKKRAEKSKQADANRALYGRTGDERKLTKAVRDKADRQHSGHYRGEDAQRATEEPQGEEKVQTPPSPSNSTLTPASTPTPPPVPTATPTERGECTEPVKPGQQAKSAMSDKADNVVSIFPDKQ